jgi:hypothetical protein
VVERKLRLNEFKAAYEALETGTVWIDHLLLGFLYYLESKLIDNRVKNEVDQAVKDYNSLSDELFMDELLGPLYTESPSKTSTSLPEMRLTAPWYDDTGGERSEP